MTSSRDLTKRDYYRMARELKQDIEFAPTADARRKAKHTAERVARLLHGTNPRYDQGRFERVAGVSRDRALDHSRHAIHHASSHGTLIVLGGLSLVGAFALWQATRPGGWFGGGGDPMILDTGFGGPAANSSQPGWADPATPGPFTTGISLSPVAVGPSDASMGGFAMGFQHPMGHQAEPAGLLG